VNHVGCVSRDLLNATTTTTLTSWEISESQVEGVQRIIERVGDMEQLARDSLITTTTTMPPCVDSDGGREKYIFSSNVSGYYEYNNSVVSGISEYCLSDQRLMEFYCENKGSYSVLKSIIIDCGTRCEDGRCCRGHGRSCDRDIECCSGACRNIGLNRYCL
jgi:hypothetical protein